MYSPKVRFPLKERLTAYDPDKHGSVMDIILPSGVNTLHLNMSNGGILVIELFERVGDGFLELRSLQGTIL